MLRVGSMNQVSQSVSEENFMLAGDLYFERKGENWRNDNLRAIHAQVTDLKE